MTHINQPRPIPTHIIRQHLEHNPQGLTVAELAHRTGSHGAESKALERWLVPIREALEELEVLGLAVRNGSKWIDSRHAK
ncbi:hypothetical protein UFOVP602_28 [uncultured Caudovirales phage]|jgi:antitoxin component HigA of HigAB toxin-antitoxin module|uniref:Uncharacterized protein n=1 Tax=uncultured Caudovirales phage TaxID=2100421 RepID=A0A6J5NB93_9CAUD|nr:hypothetical protein UFOVP602_28 [uncultured Caudovirales phage]